MNPRQKVCEQKNAYVWAMLYGACGLKKDMPIIEVAPGSGRRIAVALKLYRFKGTFYFIEPDPISAALADVQYRTFLPLSEVIPVEKTLEESTGEMPVKVGAVLANHSIDDMIAGKAIADPSMPDFEGNYFDCTDHKMKGKYWEAMEAEPERMEAIKSALAGEFTSLIGVTHPDVVILAQYPSSFFRRHRIKAPDKHAFDVLQKIRESVSGDYNQKAMEMIERHFGNSHRWLIVQNPVPGSEN